jgi:hypothetical protein
VRAASEIADWWDGQRRTSMKALDEFVDAYPNWFGVAIAGTVATSIDLGSGLVDVLRLVEGAAEGSVSRDRERCVAATASCACVGEGRASCVGKGRLRSRGWDVYVGSSGNGSAAGWSEGLRQCHRSW